MQWMTLKKNLRKSPKLQAPRVTHFFPGLQGEIHIDPAVLGASEMDLKGAKVRTAWSWDIFCSLSLGEDLDASWSPKTRVGSCNAQPTAGHVFANNHSPQFLSLKVGVSEPDGSSTPYTKYSFEDLGRSDSSLAKQK